MKVYHVSHVPNLTVIEPRVSTHRKPWVYATSNLAFGLLFGSTKDHGDFDGIYDAINETVAEFHEAFPDSFKKRFENETCYIYEVDPTTFQGGRTSCSGEVVSEVPVKVINCTKVDNLYKTLLELKDQGKLILEEYHNDPEYVTKIRAHIKDRIIKTRCYLNDRSKYYQLCLKEFPDLLQEVAKEQQKKQELTK